MILSSALGSHVCIGQTLVDLFIRLNGLAGLYLRHMLVKIPYAHAQVLSMRVPTVRSHQTSRCVAEVGPHVAQVMFG